MTRPLRVVLVTHDPFWRLGGGERTRNLALSWMLGQLFELHLYCLAPVGEGDRALLSRLRINATLHPALPEVAAGLHGLIDSTSAGACIFARIKLHALAMNLPPHVLRILDTHDLVSDNVTSRARVGLAPWDHPMDFEQEMALLACYDHVLLIQRDDHRRVAARLGPDRALCVPHPVSFARVPVRPQGRTLGFVGSAWQANIDGLDWFAREVWPRFRDDALEFHVWGTAGTRWKPPEDARIVRHGFVADYRAIWGAMDVAINPVRWGSGLKIKTVEALGHGLPLVTTTEGARGVENPDSANFCVTDDPLRFADTCLRWLDSPGERAQLGERAHALASRLFAPERCFVELITALRRAETSNKLTAR
ncbi:glycosyltransferase [Methyloversatilis thermotolerans]|uniref:glycosyltransferase n=1 Tax=Methyloversatilis thermotolerans TaxID=1346290 RepID=UPI00037D0D40|nr:glycosyltransferase [Methyloversatilis thermotolerans]